MDLVSFPGDDPAALAALPSFDDLDRYTYLVAGCVGEFWTETTVAATPALSGWDVPRMSALGVGFGKALQLTNVLRDVPADLRAGRCYLPADWLADERPGPRRPARPRQLPPRPAHPRPRPPRRPGALPGRRGLLPRHPPTLRPPPPRRPLARPHGTRHPRSRRPRQPLARPVPPLQGQPRLGLPHHRPLPPLRSIQLRNPSLVPPPPRSTGILSRLMGQG